MADSDDARATARRHTAQLLRILRGQGSVTGPPPAPPVEPTVTVTSRPAIVAEAPIAYAGRLEPAPNPPKPRQSPEGIPAGAESPAPPCRCEGIIPTVGETLYRQEGVLGELMAQTEHLVRLNRIFRAYLPPHLHDHAALIRLDADEWIVHADSASWATRLRYALHNIRETLGRQLDIPLPKPRIRVVPAELPSRVPRPPLRLTERNAKLLQAAARNLSDERLSAALLRLAEHAGPARKAVENNRR